MAKNNNNNKRLYANITTTVAVAIFIFACTCLNRQLSQLDARLRAVEVKVAEIATVLGVRTGPLSSSAGRQDRHRPADPNKAGPIRLIP